MATRGGVRTLATHGSESEWNIDHALCWPEIYEPGSLTWETGARIFCSKWCFSGITCGEPIMILVGLGKMQTFLKGCFLKHWVLMHLSKIPNLFSRGIKGREGGFSRG